MRKLLFALLCCTHLLAHADAPTLTKAHQLISSGKPAEALELLRPMRDAEDGNAVYHYLLGIAQLDTGHLPEAEAELKRSLELKPDLAQARAELGRAYALQGDAINAYLAFKEVRAANVPPEAKAGMNRFIDGVARNLNPRKTVFGSVSLGLGYDSNVNSGTSISSITLPLFGGVTAALDPQGSPKDSAFAIVSGNLTVDKPVNDSLNFVADAAASGKFNFDSNLDTYNLSTGAISAGLRHTAGPRQLSASVSYDGLHYLNRLYRNQTGLDLGWRQIVDMPMADLPLDLDVQLRYAYLDYPDDSGRNAHRTVLNVGVRPAFFGRRIQYAPQLFGVYLGKEQTTDSAADHLSYDLWGLRAAYLDRIRTGMTWFVSGGVEQRRYDAEETLFMRKRDDRQFDVTLGLNYDLGNAWSLVPSVQWIDNDSNIPVYEFRRTLVNVAARKSF